MGIKVVPPLVPRYRLMAFEQGRVAVDRNDLSPAQLSGLIAHMMEDYPSFCVMNDVGLVVMRYHREGADA